MNSPLNHCGNGWRRSASITAGDIKFRAVAFKLSRSRPGELCGLKIEWCKDYASDTDNKWIAKVTPKYPSTTCTVTETIYHDAVETDMAECPPMVIKANKGAGCLVTNTVFFKGIPTLSQYGLAILALLMLGIGMVGFRRFV